MAYSHGTPNSIVTDGLIFYVDAANIKSYPRSGTSCTDLIVKQTGTLQSSDMFENINSGVFNFDGSDDRIDFSNDNSLIPTNAISISLWVKTSDTRNYRGLVDKWNGTSSTGYMIDLGPSGANQGKARFTIGGQTSLATTVTINDGNWHHIVATCNNTNGFIYLDGIQNNTASLTMTGISNSDNLKIGGDNVSTLYLNGQIGPTQMYNRALSASEVLQNYRALKGRFE